MSRMEVVPTVTSNRPRPKSVGTIGTVGSKEPWAANRPAAPRLAWQIPNRDFQPSMEALP